MDMVAVRRGERQIGAYVDGPQGVRYLPAVDVTAVLVAAFAAAAVSAVALANRRRPVVGAVTMGPGGWLSIKRAAVPPLRAAAAERRPWWAHVLRAHRLVVRR